MTHFNGRDFSPFGPPPEPNIPSTLEELEQLVEGATRIEAGEDLKPEGWPEPMGKAAFYGLAGEFVDLVLPQTEADPHALLLCFLVAFGCMVGRKPHKQVEATRHGVNLFLALVGTTSSGRKGTAHDRAIHILNLVDPIFMKKRKLSGLSSGEGLIEAVRDDLEEEVEIKDSNPQKFEKRIVAKGEPDKRLLAVEPEFSTVLQQFGRTGNNLSGRLRNAWDGTELRNLARSNKDSCAEPHISLVAHVTPEELLKLMTTTEMANGLGNRFLWGCSRRSKLLPYGGEPLDGAKLDALHAKLKLAYDKAQTIGEVKFDSKAHAGWAPVYRELSTGAQGMFGALTARAAPQVIRLAIIYALLDRSDKITLPHLEAALEVWGYCEESVRYIFGDSLGDETADAILHMLRAAPEGMTRTEINRGFGSHKSAAELDRALAVLENRHKVKSEPIDTDGGRPAVRWRATSA